METANLFILLSAILLCFVLQTFIMKGMVYDSSSSVEDTLEKSQNKIQKMSQEKLDLIRKLSEEKLLGASGIIDEGEKTLRLQEIPTLVSNLNQVHEKQTQHEEHILHILNKLEEFESRTEEKISQILNKLEELESHSDQKYITVSWRQFLWVVFGMVITCAINGHITIEKERDSVAFLIFFGAANFVLLAGFYIVFYFQ